jgi:hypothetical protein
MTNEEAVNLLREAVPSKFPVEEGCTCNRCTENNKILDALAKALAKDSDAERIRAQQELAAAKAEISESNKQLGIADNKIRELSNDYFSMKAELSTLRAQHAAEVEAALDKIMTIAEEAYEEGFCNRADNPDVGFDSSQAYSSANTLRASREKPEPTCNRRTGVTNRRRRWPETNNIRAAAAREIRRWRGENQERSYEECVRGRRSTDDMTPTPRPEPGPLAAPKHGCTGSDEAKP